MFMGMILKVLVPLSAHYIGAQVLGTCLGTKLIWSLRSFSHIQSTTCWASIFGALRNLSLPLPFFLFPTKSDELDAELLSYFNFRWLIFSEILKFVCIFLSVCEMALCNTMPEKI